MQRTLLLAWLDELLATARFSDACPNGMQVFGKDDIGCLATCTSVSREALEQARKHKADALLVHHGMFWDGASRVIDPWTGQRLRLLLESGMNLLAYHLPLDAHPQVGNNAGLARLLALAELHFDFGHYKGMAIGCRGELATGAGIEDLAQQLAGPLGATPWILPEGPALVRRVGIVSGGAGDIPMVLEAKGRGLDAFVTGVVAEQTVAVAQELGMHLVALGHYNSEKLGVRALGDRAGWELSLEVVHLDVPNPI